MLIPAWIVSLFAFLAAWALWLVRPMPIRIRVSLIAPLAYFGFLYLWAQTLPLQSLAALNLFSLGMLLIFLSVIYNAAIVRWYWSKKRWL